MKVFVQVIDTRTGISQNGMIEESTEKGFEIANALGHFGVGINTITWLFEHSNSYISKCGEISGTTKIVNIIGIQQYGCVRPTF